jgi:phytoene dehydrogenase-like protein
VIRRGELMGDPSLLVTNPSRTDPSVAPPGRQTSYVLAPAPNLATGPFDWRGGLAERHANEPAGVLEQRGRGSPGRDDGIGGRAVGGRPFRGTGDVARHATEDDGVER